MHTEPLQGGPHGSRHVVTPFSHPRHTILPSSSHHSPILVTPFSHPRVSSLTDGLSSCWQTSCWRHQHHASCVLWVCSRDTVAMGKRIGYYRPL